jgi:hypothetical protein
MATLHRIFFEKSRKDHRTTDFQKRSDTNNTTKKKKLYEPQFVI